jgi:hypothetical protein
MIRKPVELLDPADQLLVDEEVAMLVCIGQISLPPMLGPPAAVRWTRRIRTLGA